MLIIWYAKHDEETNTDHEIQERDRWTGQAGKKLDWISVWKRFESKNQPAALQSGQKKLYGYEMQYSMECGHVPLRENEGRQTLRLERTPLSSSRCNQRDPDTVKLASKWGDCVIPGFLASMLTWIFWVQNPTEKDIITGPSPQKAQMPSKMAPSNGVALACVG